MRCRLAILFALVCVNADFAHADSNIIGGQEIPAGDPVATTTVALVVSQGFVCSASVVDDDLIVTAAHCATQGLSAVFSTRASDRNAPVRAIDALEVHPLWGSSGSGGPGKPEVRDRHDIALLHFKGGVPTGFSKARLMPPKWKVATGLEVVVAGFGASVGAGTSGTGVLRKADVRISDAGYAQTEITVDQTEGHGACHGDSGGPAFWVRNGTYYLFGLTNRSRDDRECQGETVYALINAHIQWLVETAEKLRSHRTK